MVLFHISSTYSRLFEEIYKIERALRAYGIGKGDVVSVSLPAIPEAVFLFYAINKIGAVYCALDCRSKSDEIKETLNITKAKMCFIADFHVKEFKDITTVPIVCIRATNFLSDLTKLTSLSVDFFTGRLFIKLKMKNTVWYSKFISKHSLGSIKESDSNGNDICAYFYTSGTTSGRKCVVLSNLNINSAVYQQSKTIAEISKGERMLNIMPPFTCYGLTLGTHLPLSLGVQVRLRPLFNPNHMKDLLLLERPNYIITVPSHWDHFINENFDNCDLSFLKLIIVGGDKLNQTYKNIMENILKGCNSAAWLSTGYGLTETTSTAASPSTETPYGSVGKPVCQTKIIIVDPDTNEELPIGQKGEICITGPSVCQGYLGDIVATNKLLRIHNDGITWLHSGDIGYFDNDGYLYFCERIKRMFVRHDGTKISPYSIEQSIMKCSIVKQCMVVAVPDQKHSHGKVAKALIVLHDNVNLETSLPVINKFIKANLPTHMHPEQIEIVTELPLTHNGKLNYFSE